MITGKEKVIRMKGTVTHGMHRGGQLIKHFHERLTGILGFKPFLGTLNVKLEQHIDIKDFETKRLEHILMNGSSYVDARLAPIKLIVNPTNSKSQDISVSQSYDTSDSYNTQVSDSVSNDENKTQQAEHVKCLEQIYDCWAIREERCIHDPDVLEIITRDDLREVFDLKHGTEVCIEFVKIPIKSYSQLRAKLKSMLFQEHRIMR